MNREITSSSQLKFLSGGGEMGERIRRYDWTQTQLGAIEKWPQSLKTSVSLMLNSQHPMWIGWGSDVTFLYNDAYIQVLSQAKHPWALGLPTQEVWREIWDICGPLADKVFERGEPSFLNDVRLFMNRGDFLEETFYSFSYSPIRDEAGNIGGLFCPSTEVTAKALNTRRLEILSELAADPKLGKSAQGACASAAVILAKNQADLPFVLLYLIDPEKKHASLEQASGLPGGNAELSPHLIDLLGPEAEALLWPMQHVARTGQAQLVDLPPFPDFPLGAAEQRITQAITLPLISRGQEHPLGLMVAGINPARRIDSDYRTFYDLVAGHVATGIQNARIIEEEKRRADTLAELDRAKTVFFSNVSHELRTPLTLILGPLEDEMRASPEPNERLELVHRNSLRLLKLVNTLLDFSRIEAGRMDVILEPTDLASFTAELASIFRSGMERAGLTFSVACPPLPQPVQIDRNIWEKIIFNLLSNAMKFTAQGEIELKLGLLSLPGEGASPATPAAKWLCLTVRDTGIGIPSAELPHVFERFHRIKNNWARSHEGTGIGLALVQELTRLHGGQVEVASEEGRGTLFTVWLPAKVDLAAPGMIAPAHKMHMTSSGLLPYVEETLAWMPKKAVKPEPGSHPNLPKSPRLSQKLALAALELSEPGPTISLPEKNGNGEETDEQATVRILLADDNHDMRSYVQRLLTRKGYEVIGVADGQAALEAARTHAPSLILSDVMMPRLDGFELLRELRQDPATQAIPIILLSARAGEEARIEGIGAGADDYLTKPFSARELLARVATHLDLARIRREAQEAILQREALYRAIGESIDYGVWVCDTEGRNTYVSDSFLKLLGITQEQCSSFGWVDVLHPEDAQATRAAWEECVRTGTKWDREHRFKGVDGAWHSLLARGVPIRDAQGKVLYWAGINLDISRLKETENALVLTHNQLADKATHLEALVQQRTVKLSETIGELEAFSYSIAHDMRAPLRSLQGYSDILLSDHSAQLEGPGQHFLQRIAASAARMDRLIQDILSYSRVVRGELPLEKVELEPLFQDIVETYPALAADKADILLEGPFPPVLGNEAMLMQIFSNLMGNAVKFVSAGVRPRLRIWTETHSPHIRIFIQDNGIGIAADQQEKIFEIFQQVNRDFEGTGIGLAIVKKAVERLGGKMGLQSELHHGSTFWIELQLAAN